MPTVVVDPGHGGTVEVGGSSPNNAVGPTGLLEKDVTLQVATRMKASAKKHAVVLTRERDTNLGLAARARVAKDRKAPAFVSVHFNGWPTSDVQGTETYVHASGSVESLALAKAVHSNVLAATGLKDRGLKRAAFVVLEPTHHAAETAACLVEISFMTQASEESRLRTPAYLDRLAEAVNAAIGAYLTTPDLTSSELAAAEMRALPQAPGDEDAAGANLGL